MAGFLFCVQIRAQTPERSHFSLTTEERVRLPNWWPTKGGAVRADFVGTSECAKCHEQIAARQVVTPMAHASAPAAESEVFQTHRELSAQMGAYRYELSTDGTTVNFSVTDGTDSLSGTVAWAFGLGHKGQTYIYERDGEFYESRLSFYMTLQRLDLTTGHSSMAPDDLKSAMGRWLDGDQTRRCFGCHTTGSTTDNHFDTAHLTPGVTCEGCHGPGARHVAAMKAGKIETGRVAIFDPRRLDPVASVDFCGACHRSWSDVMLAGTRGVINARFQPYRLEKSKCWRRGDARLTCIACHDPHEPLVQDAAGYDKKCLACHTTTVEKKMIVGAKALLAQKGQGGHLGSGCPVSTKNCVTCHMPQIEIPSIHAPFTDHDIRIVRGGGSYPN